MSHVPWSVSLSVCEVCVCQCVGNTGELCQKTAESTKMRLVGLTHVGPRNHVVDVAFLLSSLRSDVAICADGVKIGRIHPQPRGVTHGIVHLTLYSLQHQLTVLKGNFVKLILTDFLLL